jgi:hypothetical protein
MKKLLEQALVDKDAPKAKCGLTPKNKKRGGLLTSRKESWRSAEQKVAKQEAESEMESELESHSD